MAESTASMEAEAPVLSVVVTVVDGGEVLSRLLDAVERQDDPPRMEIIVPFDASIPEAADLRGRHPNVRFLDLGAVATKRPVTSEAGRHELYDRRRAAGLGAARGALVAMIEDRGVPRADWARSVVRVHERPPGVIGGAVEAGPSSTLNWAVYVCDFGRYGLPFESGPVGWVTDINVSYKRGALEETRHLWSHRFQEPVVHWALLERGHTLYMSSEIVVEYRRPPCSLGRLLRERFHWGRLFGQIRANHVGDARRLALAAVGPLIPIVLLIRHGSTQAKKGNTGRYLASLPAVAALLLAWTSGEVWGYITKRA